MTDISLKWVQRYVDSLLRVASTQPESKLSQVAMIRADNVMDMVLAWRDRDKSQAEKELEGDAAPSVPLDYGYRVRQLHHRLAYARPRHHVRVGLMINGEIFELHPNRRICIMENFPLNVGHTLDLVIVFLDTNGNPMLTQPTLDAPAMWTDGPSGSGVDTLTVAPDTLSAAMAALGPGTDTVSVSLSVGGKAFSATAGATITNAPQILGSIELQGTVS
jgi:hypothetical protein